VGAPDDPIGVIALGTTDEDVARTIEDQLPAAIEFAAAAGGLIAAPLAIRRRLLASRRRIEATIASGDFVPVFQPIVNIKSGIPVGFEALTRFGDGARPDLSFADAWASGIGPELEAATLERTIAASAELPVGPWLGLNVSAAMILQPDRLAAILARCSRPIVLEITEHDVITDYGAVREAVARLGLDLRVAVDDAGAGAANFTHIVELRPDFVKVDVGLVRDMDRDLTRQALIVGLRHFAHAIDGWLIAEGVETEEERQALIALGIQLGQGYLLGRPADALTWSKLGSVA
jgi:EAL domain-containing protein (putative c-di-GMP-specific phosphodiesterase class I)